MEIVFKDAGDGHTHYGRVSRQRGTAAVRSYCGLRRGCWVVVCPGETSAFAAIIDPAAR